MEQNLTDQELVRREKLDELEALGVAPYGNIVKPTAHAQEIIDEYDKYDKEELAEIGKVVTVAGRIMTKRMMGKAAFVHIQDKTGAIQLYIRKDQIEDQFDVFKLSDIGDIIAVEGEVFKTNHGELSVKATDYTHLTKALRPLPEKYHGLSDIEERYRRRYVDLIMNEDARRAAYMRPKVIRAIQHYFDDKGLLEVETPVLQSILGGAAAKPFVTHHNALDRDFYLRIATELPLKRLIVGGMEGVYEIGRLFRNEGMSPKHSPEFTTVEAYMAYCDMNDMMEVVEELIEQVTVEALGTTDLTYDGTEISMKAPFKRIKMTDAIHDEVGIDFDKITDLDEALALAKKHGIEVDDHAQSVGHITELFFDKYVEEKIIQPTFIYHYPIEISPLASKNKDDDRYTDRFELFIDGREYANAYTELNDPIDQKERFEAQVQEAALGNEEATEMDTDFVEALEYGMPPTGGLGIGVDRLMMLLTDSRSIRDVILFPHMRNR